MREYLRSGLTSCEQVLRGLGPENFVRWSPTAHKHLGCINSITDVGLVAEVCKPDTRTHTIAIASGFCSLNRDMRIFGTNMIRDGNSQLLTLVHEVTHFDDVFGSRDDWYGTKNSRAKALERRLLESARSNADSLAAYIVGAQRI